MITKEYFNFVLAPMCALFTVVILVAHVGIYKVASSKTEDSKRPLKV